MRFTVGLLLALFFVATTHAHAALRCQGRNEQGFLLIEKESNGLVHVETAETRRFLLGLDCRLPRAGEPLFYCTGGGGENLEFYSAWIRERGYVKNGYGEFVERELLDINLRYTYKDANNQDHYLERNWKFQAADCEGSL